MEWNEKRVAGGDSSGSDDGQKRGRGGHVLRDRSAHRAVRHPGPPPRRHFHGCTDAGRVRRLGQQEREKHRLGANQIRIDGGRSRSHRRPVHGLQHEPGQVVGTGALEQSVVPSLDLLVRPHRWRPSVVLHVQNHLRREEEQAGGACRRSCGVEQRGHPEGRGTSFLRGIPFLNSLIVIFVYLFVCLFQSFSHTLFSKFLCEDKKVSCRRDFVSSRILGSRSFFFLPS